MKQYTNSLGITCLEPRKGYLLKKNGQTYKIVYLGKNDKVELYEEIKDPDYTLLLDEEEIVDNKPEPTEEEFYILTSPSGKKFKLTVDDNGELITKEIK